MNTGGSNPIYIIPILEHIASGKADLQLTDLEGIVKMMVGETE